MSMTGNESVLWRKFRYFDPVNECEFPTRQQVRDLARAGLNCIISFDANICLTLAQFGRNRIFGNRAGYVHQFVFAMQDVGLTMMSHLGCVELACSSGRREVDGAKYESLMDNIDLALNSCGARVSAESGRDESRRIAVSTFKTLRPVFEVFYAGMLKIWELGSRPNQKSQAVKHLLEFYEWCESIPCQSTMLLQLALAKFGGEKSAAKFLVLEKEPLNEARKSAWDVIQIQFPRQVLPLMGQKKCWTLFVTDDQAAAYVAGLSSHCIQLVNGEEFLATFRDVSAGFPYFEGRYEELSEQLKKMQLATLLRTTQGHFKTSPVARARVTEEIELLEKLVAKNWLARNQQ